MTRSAVASPTAPLEVNDVPTSVAVAPHARGAESKTSKTPHAARFILRLLSNRRLFG
jgi:hypothetical protein